MRKEESLVVTLHSGLLLPSGGAPHDLQYRAPEVLSPATSVPVQPL